MSWNSEKNGQPKWGDRNRQRPRSTYSSSYDSGYYSADTWETSSQKEARKNKERQKKRKSIFVKLALLLGVSALGFGAASAFFHNGEEGTVNDEALQALVSPTATLVMPNQQETLATEVVVSEEPTEAQTEILVTENPTEEPIQTEVTPDPTEESTQSTFTPEPTIEPTIQPTIQPTVEPPTQTELPDNGQTEYRIANGSIQLNRDGIPISYTLNNGVYVEFTPQQQAEFAAARQAAIASGEPEILLSISLSSPDQAEHDNPGTEDRPRLEELPTDILTESELQELGVIDIIQATNTQFYIRESAFAEGGILEDLAATQSLEHPINVRLVFVNGPLISQNFMSDSRYDDVRDLVPYISSTDIEAYRAEQIALFEEGLEQVRADYPDDDSFILIYKRTIYDYQHMSDEQIMGMIVAADGNHAAGLFVPATQMNPDGSLTGTIFVATGNTQRSGGGEVLLYFDEDGSLQTQQSATITWDRDYRPSVSAAFPRPADFDVNPNAQRDLNQYPYGAQTLGQILDHELKHLDLMMVQPALNGEPYNPNEFDTDTAAMEEIESQYDAWVASGYQDNSMYPWVFSIPDELGGGYMLTFDRSETDKENPVNDI